MDSQPGDVYVLEDFDDRVNVTGSSTDSARDYGNVLGILHDARGWKEEFYSDPTLRRWFPDQEWNRWESRVLRYIDVYLQNVIYTREEAQEKYQGMTEEKYVERIHEVWEAFQLIRYYSVQMNQRLIHAKHRSNESFSRNWKQSRDAFLNAVELGFQKFIDLYEDVYHIDSTFDALNGLKL